MNVHDVNNCFNFTKNITSTKFIKQVRTSKDLWKVYMNYTTTKNITYTKEKIMTFLDIY